MGDKGLEPETTEIEESYMIKELKGSDVPQDRINIIRAPFLNTLRQKNDWFKLIDHEHFFEVYPKFINLLISRENTRVRFAELSDQTILGWCVYENKIVHYIWVKKEVRRQGIAQALLPIEFEAFSHITNMVLRLWNTFYKEKRFTPFV